MRLGIIITIRRNGKGVKMKTRNCNDCLFCREFSYDHEYNDYCRLREEICPDIYTCHEFRDIVDTWRYIKELQTQIYFLKHPPLAIAESDKEPTGIAFSSCPMCGTGVTVSTSRLCSKCKKVEEVWRNDK